ncbi:MAG: magnesium-protoporphyrin IX monomethyl ester (oxidative) cyclase [Gemmatimonadaceae bacterium]|nr:magnesium-protoporphyrin IX monomethyl ester (oxidative) cyclase [Gloeobacterales cyanobacterium ES-bin-141]
MAEALEAQRSSYKQPVKETLLTPRFYTTDFEEMANLDISAMEEDFQAILAEFRADYNREHFVRDQDFSRQAAELDPESRALMVQFLERSCTSEFSGFLLYKELSRRLKERSPVLAECFQLMSRDEARHSGFLNKAMSDFNLALDLSFLTRNKKYTFFKPKFIFYATYLSEKIGYWRYITIFRHLEKHPEKRFHPLFNFFKNWCQDENRHGDFFGLLLKSQPALLNSPVNRLWIRFFLLAVLVTMYLNDRKPDNIYTVLGLDAKQYALEVLRELNQDSARVFPVVLDIENPRFLAKLDACADYNVRLEQVAGSGGGLLRKLPLYIGLGLTMAGMYLHKPLDAPRPNLVY